MSDLISRQDVVDALELRLENDYVDSYEFLSFVKQLPSAEPERKWIPVTEALPKNGRQVLVYAQSVHYALAKYDEMMQPDGKWIKEWVTFDAWKPYYTIKNVIAWMPLPEPWRGEE